MSTALGRRTGTSTDAGLQRVMFRDVDPFCVASPHSRFDAGPILSHVVFSSTWSVFETRGGSTVFGKEKRCSSRLPSVLLWAVELNRRLLLVSIAGSCHFTPADPTWDLTGGDPDHRVIRTGD